jgi:hypothetical protein
VSTPYRDELLRRLRLGDPAAAALDDQRIRFTSSRRGEVLVVAPEDDLAAAVQHLGEDSRDALWPDVTVDTAGFNLLLVHLEEILATRRVTAPLVVTRTGPTWPDADA